MSSSSDERPYGVVRGRVLRGGVTVAEAPVALPAALGRDLDAVAESVRAWSPEQVAAALAAGYRDGHDQGVDDGYAEGLAQGLAQAQALEAQRQARFEHVCAALRSAADDLRHRHVEAVVALEAQLVDLVVGLTESLLGHELRGGDVAVEAVRRGLALTAPGKPAVARLHPEEVAALLPMGETGGTATWHDPTTGRSVQVIADARVAPGGCVVDAGDATVDAQFGPALERIRAALLGRDVEELTA
jgi:flagellar assembly protein FliH